MYVVCIHIYMSYVYSIPIIGLPLQLGFRSLKENGLPTFIGIGYTLVKGIEIKFLTLLNFKLQIPFTRDARLCAISYPIHSYLIKRSVSPVL